MKKLIGGGCCLGGGCGPDCGGGCCGGNDGDKE